MGDFGLIWAVLLLPVFGFLIQALLGKRIVDALGLATGKRVMGFLAVLPIAVGFLIGLMLTHQLIGLEPAHRSVVVYGAEWINILGLRVPFELVVDPLSMTMVLIVTGIGSLIHLYSTGYMAEEKDYTRFFTYLNLFIASMLILVLGANLVMLFIGWEGVGLCSYLLIGFWYKDVANSKAANKAFITNRVGDWGLTLGIFLIFTLLSGMADKVHVPDGRFLSYDVMIPLLGKVLLLHPAMATAIALLLFVGACGKSAQFPLYLWLPDAMAGPTPVSALIHAATMVTSGVVLLNRMNIVFVNSATASAVVCAVGAFTALFAAVIAFGQTDIKKVLAYSTVSQLGFMFVACGAGSYWAGMFHVTTHAFFKALLFLGSGAVIYAMAHNQDMRNYGNLKKYLPVTCVTMFIGFMAISGVPGFAGFFSKEAIIGSALANEHAMFGETGVNVSWISGWVALGVAALTAMYMTRMTWLTFFGGEERWRKIPVTEHGHDHDHAHDEHLAHVAHADHGGHGPDVNGFFYTDEELEARVEPAEHHHALDGSHTPKEVPLSMSIPLIVLAVASVVGGFLLEKVWSLEKWLYPEGVKVLGEVPVETDKIPLMALSIVAATLGLGIGYAVYRKGLPEKEGWDLSKWNPFRKWAGNQFGYDNTVVTACVQGGGDLGRVLWKGADASFIDGIVNGVAWLAGALGRFFRVAQNGLIRSYALLMLVGGLFFLGYFTYVLNLVHLGGGH